MFFTLLPLLAVIAILSRRRLRFSLRSLLLATTLVACFLVLSLLPLLQHRAARNVSSRLLAANVTINEGMDWDNFYAQIKLGPTRKPILADSANVPPWLTSFTVASSATPPDNAVRSIWLQTDQQCRLFADNWDRLPSLQSVGIGNGVSAKGFQLLQQVLPQLTQLDSVFTNDVLAPPNWYESLTNIRTLWVWGEGASRGTPFDKEHLKSIASLSNLEMFMVLGYSFNDDDARTLASSDSIRRVIFRGTAVTQNGESVLANTDRLVYRN